jgi:hypothetical protein
MPRASKYCGTVVTFLRICLWKSRVRLISHSTPLKDALLFRSLRIPCTVRQPAKSTFTWPLICSPQKYMWSGSSKMTSNWRISSGTCLLQNSCNTRHTAISVILYLNTPAYITHLLKWDMQNFYCVRTAYLAFNPLKTRRRLLYLKTQSVPRCKHFSSRLQNQSVYAVSGTSRCLFSDKYKTHKYSVGRAYSCRMLNLLAHHVKNGL